MRAWVLNYCVTVGCVGVSGEKTLLQLYSICVDPDGQRCVPLGCVPLTVGCVGSWSHPFIRLQHGCECAIVLACKASLPSLSVDQGRSMRSQEAKSTSDQAKKFGS